MIYLTALELLRNSKSHGLFAIHSGRRWHFIHRELEKWRSLVSNFPSFIARALKEENLNFFPKDDLIFFLYYVYVVDILDKMYRKRTFTKTPISFCPKRQSNGLVLERTTEEGKNIRVNSADELLPLLQSGAFGFFLENNKCFLEQSNCRACNQSCWPNVVVDIKPWLESFLNKMFWQY